MQWPCGLTCGHTTKVDDKNEPLHRSDADHTVVIVAS